MRIRLVSLSIFLLLCGMTLTRTAAAQSYYVALGDSLAVGYQPISGPPYTQGYADDLFALYSPALPRPHSYQTRLRRREHLYHGPRRRLPLS